MTEVTALEVQNLVKHFHAGARRVRAVDGISFSVAAGETLGIVGESGCGKSTLARTILRLIEPTSGQVLVGGLDVTAASRRQLRTIRRELQIVFQDPFASLNPRRRAGDAVAHPLRVHGLYEERGGASRVAELFELVGLTPEQRNRYPHQLSGGQRQRVGLARALALEPRVLILDEPVSSLDVSIRSQIVQLLARLQRELGLTYVFISHDLAVVRQLATRVAVMYLGRIVEMGGRDEIYGSATHPYTQALLSAVPVTDPDRRDQRRRIILAGEPPDPAAPPSGCHFRTRCWKGNDHCAEVEPELIDRVLPHPSACHFADPGDPPPAGPALPVSR